jgi:hypothetical protein
MRLVIIKETNSVGKDDVFYNDLDLSSCGLPENLWALQWYDNNTGHIEYNSATIQNDNITELPSWSNNCIAVWQTAHDEEQARIAELEALAAQIAAEQAAAEQAAAE